MGKNTLIITLIVAVLMLPSFQAAEKRKVPFEFVNIEGGYFILGDTSSKINPVRKVMHTAFEISNTEITNRQFAQFVLMTRYITDAEKNKNALVFYPGLDEFEWKEDSTANWRYPNGRSRGGIEDKMDHPVTCISFHDAGAFCAWSKYRLPTLDEWEIACRANTRTKYFWGNQPDSINSYANIWQGKTHKKAARKEDYLYTAPVGSYKPNPFGLYDMYGNVFEFVSDQPEKEEYNTDLAYARGGSWWCSANSCNYFNSIDIGKVNRSASFSNHGFRVVKL